MPTSGCRCTTRRPKQLVVHGHPLTQGHSSATVLAHRWLLFEALGGRGDSCHVCGHRLHWMAKGPDELVVDHLDGDPGNNHLTNLAPACRGCNANREDGTGFLVAIVLHGTARRYRRGCRCIDCVTAMRSYWLSWREAHLEDCRRRNRIYAQQRHAKANRLRSGVAANTHIRDDAAAA